MDGVLTPFQLIRLIAVVVARVQRPYDIEVLVGVGGSFAPAVAPAQRRARLLLINGGLHVRMQFYFEISLLEGDILIIVVFQLDLDIEFLVEIISANAVFVYIAARYLHRIDGIDRFENGALENSLVR